MIVIKPTINMYMLKVNKATIKYICADRLYLYELLRGASIYSSSLYSHASSIIQKVVFFWNLKIHFSISFL